MLRWREKWRGGASWSLSLYFSLSVPAEAPAELRSNLRAWRDDPGVQTAAQEEEASGQEEQGAGVWWVTTGLPLLPPSSPPPSHPFFPSFSFSSFFALTAEFYSSEVVCWFSCELGGGAVHLFRFLTRWLWLFLLQNGQLQQRLETVERDFIVFNREKWVRLSILQLF